MSRGAKPGERRGGRTKGTPNKKTAEQREFLNGLLNTEREKFIQELNGLTGKAYVEAYINLLSFTVPKLKAVDLTTGGNEIDFSAKPKIVLNLHSGAKSLNNE